ncbi:MAG: YdcF family protein [Solobacterium sp.]|nr:YdcF family protein [Solobacterium sp.]
MKQFKGKQLNLWLLGTGILGFIHFACPYFTYHRNEGGLLGMILSGILILTGLFPEKIIPTVKKLYQPHKKIWNTLFLVIFIIVSAEMVLMIRGAQEQEMGRNDPVIVLGSDIKPDGTPTEMVVNRLERACQYLEDNPESIVIVCDGILMKNGMTEAQAMKNWLVEHGIEEKRILLEEKSLSTKENLENAMQLLEDPAQEVLISTNAFHQFRAQKLAHDLGMNAKPLTSPTPWYVVPTYYLRELMAIIAQFVL